MELKIILELGFQKLFKKCNLKKKQILKVKEEELRG